jgi:hypothetical protein
MTGPSALHLLDDFLECNSFLQRIKESYVTFFYIAIETIPSEIQQQLQLLQEKDIQIAGNSHTFTCTYVANLTIMTLKKNLKKIYSRSEASCSKPRKKA